MWAVHGDLPLSYFSIVMYGYEQALLALGFYPNIWYQAALYLEDRSKQLFERGVSTIKRSEE